MKTCKNFLRFFFFWPPEIYRNKTVSINLSTDLNANQLSLSEPIFHCTYKKFSSSYVTKFFSFVISLVFVQTVKIYEKNDECYFYLLCFQFSCLIKNKRLKNIYAPKNLNSLLSVEKVVNF